MKRYSRISRLIPMDINLWANQMTTRFPSNKCTNYSWVMTWKSTRISRKSTYKMGSSGSLTDRAWVDSRQASWPFQGVETRFWGSIWNWSRVQSLALICQSRILCLYKWLDCLERVSLTILAGLSRHITLLKLLSMHSAATSSSFVLETLLI